MVLRLPSKEIGTTIRVLIEVEVIFIPHFAETQGKSMCSITFPSDIAKVVGKVDLFNPGRATALRKMKL